MSHSILFSQQVDLENALKGFRSKMQQNKKLKITGGINASTTFSNSTVGGMRDPFVYSVSGNVNFSFLTVSVPLSLNLTNAGFSYSYKYPRLPNRLSIHPKYKWLQAHIGDFSMNFSPYTINGFQIVGGGLDLQPKGNLKYSAFWGRFQKAVPYLPNNGNTLAAYKRIGGGAKISLNKKNTQSAVSLISIHDVQNSLLQKPDSLHIFPKANLAIAIESKQKITKSLQVGVEMGLSFLTNDVRAQKSESNQVIRILGFMANANASTNFYKAIKASLGYNLGSSNFGIGYERVDPDYQTLGAYYFTNDLENITINFAQQLFKNKLNLSMNGGLQKDDLKGEKTGKNKRFVSSLNASFNGGKKFTSSLSYSNFQSFTNIKPQFQYINQQTPYENLDTLNFRQLSQNANMNVTYVFRSDKEKSKMMNLNLSFQDSFDEQGGVISKGNASQFYNLNASFTSVKIKSNLNYSLGLNATYNTIGTGRILTIGPTFMTGKLFFDKKVRTSFSLAYNMSRQQGETQQKIFSGRMNASYTLLKKHQLGLSGVYMNRNTKGISGNDFNTTFNYSYSF